jgi:hypothetical protein
MRRCGHRSGEGRLGRLSRVLSAQFRRVANHLAVGRERQLLIHEQLVDARVLDGGERVA